MVSGRMVAAACIVVLAACAQNEPEKREVTIYNRDGEITYQGEMTVWEPDGTTTGSVAGDIIAGVTVGPLVCVATLGGACN